MEKPNSVKIRYTANCFAQGLFETPPETPILKYSQADEPLVLQHVHPDTNTEPVLEIVTNADAITPQVIDGISRNPIKTLQNATIANIRGTAMIIHSAVLSQAVRDVVGYYPR
jgi:hypothetical protein